MGGGSRKDIAAAFNRQPSHSTPGIGDGIPGNRPIGGFQQAFGDMITANADSGISKPDPLAPLLGQAPKRDKGSFGDVLSTILAVAADATDPEGRGIYTKNLAQQWGKRGDAYDAALKTFQDRQQMASLPGMTQREMAAYIADSKAWGSNMSRAATSRYDAATLNPGDERFLGEGNGVYRAPTRGQQYARSLDLQPGTPEYETAIRDQELGAQGPTGFQNNMQLEGVRQSGRVGLENLRQKGRMGMEGVRQGNRTALRGVPTYSQLHPPPPRLGGRAVSAGGAVTATNPQTGEKMMFANGKWVPAR